MQNEQAADWLAKYEALAARRAALQPEVDAHNKQAVLAALVAAGINRIEVPFDGYGDSGQIDQIVVTDPELKALDGATGEVEIREVRDDATDISSTALGLPEAIEHLCYMLLRFHHAGWENNDGAFGDFVFDVPADSITYTHNSRWTEVSTDLHQL